MVVFIGGEGGLEGGNLSVNRLAGGVVGGVTLDPLLCFLFPFTPAPPPPPIPAPPTNPIPSEGEVGGDGGGPGRFESATRPRQISGINNEASNPSLTQDVTYLASALE